MEKKYCLKILGGQEVSYFYNNLGLVESIDTGDEPLFSFDYNENGFV